jgi:orotidine-5'-phosphate decarboxylase
MNFREKLEHICVKNDSILCIGLDTDYTKIPKFLHTYENPILAFNERIISTTKDIVCAYKLNLAFYEVLGFSGTETLMKTLDLIPNSVLKILDGKRCDIENTAKKYAKTMYEILGCDATTVNPYMGYDSVKPFLEYKDKCVFILCRTSNRSASEFQDVGDKPLYQKVAEKVKSWNRYGICGLIVGATYPEELRIVRNIVGDDIPILIPGIGVQSGDLTACVKYGTNTYGIQTIINVSRSIIYAGSDEKFDETARLRASDLNTKINKIRYEKIRR